MRIGAALATWHYISEAGLVDGGLAHGRREGDTGGAQSEAGGGARGGADEEDLAVVLELGLGQGIEVGDDLRPGRRRAQGSNAVFQFLLQHQREKAAEDMAANGLVELVEDRPGNEQVLGGCE